MEPRTCIAFDIPSSIGEPRLALGIYSLRGGYVAMLCRGDDCTTFVPSPELVALVAA